MKPAVIWIIDGDQWPRALLRAELIERGYDAVGFLTVRDAIDALPERAPDAIVVDLRGQLPRHVERLPRIGVPVIVIATAIDDEDVPVGEWARILRRPVAIGEVAAAVAAALAAPE